MNVAVPARRGPDYISLCTGGGGLDLAVELAIPSARAVVLLEREAFAVAHLVEAMRQGLMAPAPVWSDVRTFDGRQFRGRVDGVIGGIPCQPHSLAGKRLAEEDERDLWSPARRIIVQSGAWFVLIENVGGMLSSGGAERVWRDLRRLGFTVEGGLFTASEVGASHQRERLFILAVADARCPEWWPILGRGCVADRAEAGWRQGASWIAEPSQDVADDAFWPRSDTAIARGRDEREGSAGGCCGHVADAGEQRLQGRGPAGSGSRQRASVERGGCDVVDAPRFGRREGRAEPELRSGRDTAASADGARADADLAQLRQEPSAGQLAFLQQDDGIGIFPPGPGDADGWRHILSRAPHLEPAIRKLADGMASRVDQLRMLGNGVVPLEGAYAIRTLATRLAASGSIGATHLVRMMEA